MSDCATRRVKSKPRGRDTTLPDEIIKSVTYGNLQYTRTVRQVVLCIESNQIRGR